MLSKFVAAFLVLAAGTGGAGADFALEDLADGTHVVMVRHAQAPGTGDPADFRIGDCSTQRNLDETGRDQARRLGEHLRAVGIVDAAVYSSQWCRCLETARLLGLGPVEELPGLNSFHGRPQDRDGHLAALQTFFEGLGSRTPRPVILVTHFVTIAAVTGRGVGSGDARVLKLNGTGSPEPVGTIPAG
jgi:phosphohistidine phosphatase SixA